MSSTTRFKLSTMMFLQYFVWGAWSVPLGTYLGEILEFQGQQIGFVFGTTAVAAMISPFFVGMVADRYVSTERMLALLHVVGGGILFLASTLTEFVEFYSTLLLYALCYMPTLALSNSLSFCQMKEPAREFPAIRVLGTIGWIVAGLVVGFLRLEDTAHPMQIAASVSFVLGLYCLFLPHTPPSRATDRVTVRDVLGLDALQLLRERAFAVFTIGSLLVCVPLQFYYAFANPFLNEIGVTNAAGKMTLGQVSEIGFMLAMPFFFRCLGTKGMLLVAIAAWVSRYLLFAWGDNGALVWMLYGGILLHGICYDFFFVTGQVYVDHKAPPGLRASAQGLITFVTLGIGMFIGSWLSGLVVDLYAQEAGHAWNRIWTVPALWAIAVMAIFALFFKERERVVDEDSSTA